MAAGREESLGNFPGAVFLSVFIVLLSFGLRFGFGGGAGHGNDIAGLWQRLGANCPEFVCLGFGGGTRVAQVQQFGTAPVAELQTCLARLPKLLKVESCKTVPSPIARQLQIREVAHGELEVPAAGHG